MSGGLFDNEEKRLNRSTQPLAARMRPETLEEFVGQGQLVGDGQFFRRLIDADRLGSVIFHGPPGCGKTTLARLLSKTSGGRPFHTLSAVSDGVAQLRKILAQARSDVKRGLPKSIVFVDEIHRFHKGQQDALLEDVESGSIDFVGATTSNPYFAVNSALLSRSQVFELKELQKEDVVQILRSAIHDKEKGFGKDSIEIKEGALELLSDMSGGDARRALGSLEIAVLSSNQRPLPLSKELIKDCAPRSAMGFDQSGDEHYDLASALIKSIRGSQVDAALYWLARMLESGEDIRFLCRRLIILASEDIGNAAPQALSMSVACMQACEMVGLPECQWNLSQTVIYLSICPKSNSATKGIAAARQDVRDKPVLPVPLHLRDSHWKGAEDRGYGVEYQNPHNNDDGMTDQDYLGEDRQYYFPVDRGFEAEIQKRLKVIRSKKNTGT